jgi:murein DD-endopeptidase MepM/ murein hydrolase activator NlpD
VIAPPLSGEGWMNGNGCCVTTEGGHRSHRFTVDGQRIVTPETFAIDFQRVQGTRYYKGYGTRNEQYFAYGAKVSSVANGKVVFIRDGLPEQTPNAPIVGVERTLDFGGNHVVVRIGHGVYAYYAHLQPGSIDVQKGEHVKTGQLIGKLGNSGNSTGPHLHFGLSSGPESLTSNSLPFVFDRYTWAGSVDLEKSTLPNLHIEGTPRTERKSYPVTYPRALSLADF